MSDQANDVPNAAAWLARAESSLVRARIGYGVPRVALEDLAFDAQQAAEKSFKALLVARQATFPKTHDIRQLIAHVEACGVNLPADLLHAAKLTAYAVRTRYPGGPPVTEEDYRAAMQIAEEVVEWVRRGLGGADHE